MMAVGVAGWAPFLLSLSLSHRLYLYAPSCDAWVSPPLRSVGVRPSHRDRTQRERRRRPWDDAAALSMTPRANDDDDKPSRDLPTPPFTPEELMKALERMGGNAEVEVIDMNEYMRRAGGGGSDVDGGGASEEGGDAASASLESLRSFDLKPKEVVEYLDRYVIQQGDAKKCLAVAVCDHYNHCRRILDCAESKDMQAEYAKPNILLCGPTGVGKTYLMKCIARLIGVPFVKGDATKFSETGIVGRDAEDLVRDLVSAADGNATVAQYGIVYIDEVDKIAAGGAAAGSGLATRGDFNTRGVQNNFLKLLEDTDVSLQAEGPVRILGMGGGGAGSTINTRNILFIFSGAFTGLDADLRRKKETKPIGFLDDEMFEEDADDDFGPVTSAPGKGRSYLRDATTADFVRAGLEPEFVGRVPVRVALDALDAHDLKQILVSAEGSVLKQFKRDLSGYDINMTATDDALTAVAELAAEEGTGARGLVTVLERTLREHKYELPSTSVRAFALDRNTVMSPKDGLWAILSSQTAEDEAIVRLDDLKRWERGLNQGLKVVEAKAWLTSEAIDYLVGLAMETGGSTYSLASRRFEGLPAALKKIVTKTGQKQLPISLSLAKDPEGELAQWLKLIDSNDDDSANQVL